MEAQRAYIVLNCQIQHVKRKINIIELCIQIVICILMILCILPQSEVVRGVSLFTDVLLSICYFKIMSSIRSYQMSRITKKYKHLPSEERECIYKYVEKKISED